MHQGRDGDEDVLGIGEVAEDVSGPGVVVGHSDSHSEFGSVKNLRRIGGKPQDAFERCVHGYLQMLMTILMMLATSRYAMLTANDSLMMSMVMSYMGR